jgi:ribosome-binding protein aMBF1 (putative translation factor)
MTIPFERIKARLLANPDVKTEYDALAPEFEIAAELLRARLRARLSQSELAARMRTSQSTIARLESAFRPGQSAYRCQRRKGARVIL